MNPANPDPLAKLLRIGLVVGALAFLAAYLVLALQRVPYPYELEWMEGGMVDHVRRILAGERVYVQPDLPFSPYGYAPVYLWSSAALSLLLGEGFLAMRALSFVASLGSFALLFALVRRETRSPLAGLLAACLFAATFQRSGFFFDVARVDSLFVVLMLVAVWYGRRVETVRGAVGAGVLFALAVFTKQIAVPLVLAMALYFLLAQPRLFLPFTLSACGLGGGFLLLLDALHDGWASFYLFGFHAGRGVEARLFLVFLRDMALLWLPLALGAGYLAGRLRRGGDRRAGLYFGAVAGGVLSAVGYARSLELGAFVNVYMPAHAVLALLFGLGFAHLEHALERPGARARLAHRALLLAALAQFAGLVYDPRYQAPTAADREAGDRLIELVAAVEGPVWLIDHGFLATLAGKASSIHAVSIYDALSNERTRPFVQAAVLEGMRSRSYAAILMSEKTHRAMGTRFPELVRALDEHYLRTRDVIFEDPDAFFPVTGVALRPEWLYEPRP